MQYKWELKSHEFMNYELEYFLRFIIVLTFTRLHDYCLNLYKMCF